MAENDLQGLAALCLVGFWFSFGALVINVLAVLVTPEDKDDDL